MILIISVLYKIFCIYHSATHCTCHIKSKLTPLNNHALDHWSHILVNWISTPISCLVFRHMSFGHAMVTSKMFPIIFVFWVLQVLNEVWWDLLHTSYHLFFILFFWQIILSALSLCVNVFYYSSGIEVEFKGYGKVHWTERKTTGTGDDRKTETHHYTSQEKYYEMDYWVWGNGGWSGDGWMPGV